MKMRGVSGDSKNGIDSIRSFKSRSSSLNGFKRVQPGRYLPLAFVLVIAFLMSYSVIGPGFASDGSGDALPVIAQDKAAPDGIIGLYILPGSGVDKYADGNGLSDLTGFVPGGLSGAAPAGYYGISPVSGIHYGQAYSSLNRQTLDSKAPQLGGMSAYTSRTVTNGAISSSGNILATAQYDKSDEPDMKLTIGHQATVMDEPEGSSRYIVVFEDRSPVAVNMAREQVKGFTESQNGKVIHDYSIIKGMAVSIPDDKAGELAALSDVKYVERDQVAYVYLDEAVSQIDADDVWGEGYDGTGVKVCVIDTGIDAGHPDLDNGKVVGWIDYVQDLTTAYDDHGHGTHCAGTIAGSGDASSGTYKGVAPGASLMGAKVLDQDGRGLFSDIIAAINWAVANDAQVISMSLGGPQHVQAMDDAISNAIGQGVVVVIAAGNDGPVSGTIGCPGDCPGAITVGAVDRNDVIASFSSRGPTDDGYIKPDVTNMGVGLVAARASGTSRGTPVNDYYTALSGTSMACPMTSGVVALLLETNPGFTPAQVKDALTKTAKPLGTGIPNNIYGYGRVQAKAAFDYLQGGSVTPTPAPTPGPYGPPQVTWSKSFEGDAYDHGESVQQTSDGGYVATGSTYRHGSYDVYLVKTDAAGNLIWNRTYGGYKDDNGRAVRQTSDGGYIIAGSTESYTSVYQSIYLIKTDAAGNMEWNRTFTRYFSDEARDVQQTSDGGYIITGLTYVGPPNDGDVYVIKTDASGNEEWSKRFGGSDYDSGDSVQQTSDGGYIITGTHADGTTYTTSAYLIKIDSIGNNVWSYFYQSRPGANTYGSSVQQLSDGYIVSGTSYPYGNSNTADVYLMRTNDLGIEQWNKTLNYSTGVRCYGLDVRRTADGGYVVVGSRESNYVYLMKTDSSGAMLWQKSFQWDPSIMNSGYSVQQTGDGGYVVCGLTMNYNTQDMYLIKTSSSGDLQWSHTYGEKSTDTCTWAQQTSDGGYILAGTTDCRNMEYDMSLVKVDINGNVEWRNAYGENYDDLGSMALQTADGGYVVAGSTREYAGSYTQAYLIKANQLGEWTDAYAYGSSSDCWANAVQATGDGGYIIAGGKYDPSLGDCDVYLVKTDASGNEIWGKTSGGYSDDWASSVLQTSDGGYLTVGGSYSDGSGNCDVNVKKFNSAGVMLWGNYYYTESDIWGNGVLQATDGGFIITGGARQNDGETKIMLLKIDCDGYLQWYHYYGDSVYQEGLSIRPATDGGYLIGGTTYDNGDQNYRMAIVKTDAAGNYLWGGSYGEYGNSYGYYAQQTGDGGYLLAGTTFQNNNSQACLVKLGMMSSVSTIGFASASSTVTTSGTDLTVVVRRDGDSSGPASATVSVSGGTAVYGNDFTTNPALPWTVSFSAGEVEKTLTVHVTYGIVGKSFGLQLSGFFGATPGTCTTHVITIIKRNLLPIESANFPNMTTTTGLTTSSGVSGRVTTFQTTVGIANADIYIVNASNISQYYWHGTTNAQGFFEVANVNNTWVDDNWLLQNPGYTPFGYMGAAGYYPLYKMYCYSSSLGEGYSNNFTVEVSSTAAVNVIVNPTPASIVLSGSKANVVANENDYITISAYVTDAQGQAVADNWPITFWVNQSDWVDNRNGSLGHDGINDNVQYVTVGTANGYATVSFGWVNSAYAGTVTRINATFAMDYSIRSQIDVPISIVQVPPKIGFVTAHSTMTAGGADATIAIRRYGDTSMTASVVVWDGGGTADSGTDYTTSLPPNPATVSFAAGESEKTIRVHASPGSGNKLVKFVLYDVDQADYGDNLIHILTILPCGKPIQTVPAPVMDPSHNAKGGVSGRVMLKDTTTGLAGTYVAILNASNVRQAYCYTTTDSQGYFEFTNINNTYNEISGTYDERYRLYANQTVFGDGYSGNFSVMESSTAAANVDIIARPWNIYIAADRETIMANGTDKTLVWTYVTDAFNNPVADDTLVVFTAGNYGSYNATPGGGFRDLPGPTFISTTYDGYVLAYFGWVPASNAGYSLAVTAASICDPAVKGTTNIYFQAADSITFSITLNAGLESDLDSVRLGG